MVGVCTAAVVVQTSLEAVDLVHEGEIPHLGQTADLAVMVELHPWVELVVVQEADCNGTVDFADFRSLQVIANATSRQLYRGLCTIVFH